MTNRHHMRAAGTTATILVLALALVGCGSGGGNAESGPARGPVGPGGGGVAKPDTGAADGTTSTGEDPQSTFAVDVDTASYGYARRQMSAFVELQQAEFADAARGYTAVKHQAEVGTGYFDQVATALNPTAGTLAMSGSTEAQQFA